MRKAFAAFFALLFLACAGYIAYYFLSLHQYSGKIASLGEQIQPISATEESTPAKLDFSALQAQNPDIVAWIKIEGTSINYPVMQRPGDDLARSYYLTHGFQGESDKNGLPFLDGRNTISPPQKNWIIYGHNMKSGVIFHDLSKYNDRSFWDSHPTILLDTPDGRREFQIFAVVTEKIAKQDAFQYNALVDFTGDAKAYQEFVEKVKKNALYDTDQTPPEGSQLITLSTCDNLTMDGRIAVFGYERSSSQGDS